MNSLNTAERQKYIERNEEAIIRIEALTAERDNYLSTIRAMQRADKLRVAEVDALQKEVEAQKHSRGNYERAAVALQKEWENEIEASGDCLAVLDKEIESLTAERDAFSEQLECANQNMKAMNANGDKLRAEITTLTAAVEGRE